MMYLQHLTHVRISALQDAPFPLLLLIGMVVVAIIIWNQWSRQRLVSGVPIVGGEDTAAIKQSRIRFVHDGMRMLQEGYQAVCCLPT